MTSAIRTHASQEFNHGLVFSSAPLQDDQIFEVNNAYYHMYYKHWLRKISYVVVDLYSPNYQCEKSRFVLIKRSIHGPALLRLVLPVATQII